jgi:hypothetical protein
MENNVFFNFNSVSSMSNYNTRGTLNPPYTYSPNYTVASRIYNFDRNNPQNNIDPLEPYKILVTNALDTSNNIYIYDRLVYKKTESTSETAILETYISELNGATILSLEIISVLDTVTEQPVYIPPEDLTYAFDIKTSTLTITIIGFSETYSLLANLIASVSEDQNMNVKLNIELYYSEATTIVPQPTPA